MKVGFISLGCNKNLVDTEKTIALFKEHGYEIVNNPEIAEVIIINTCGFISSAKEEAINTILEMAEHKNQNCKYLIAMGCLVERYKKELEKSIPEVDLYIKYSEYSTLWEQIDNLLSNGNEKVDFENFTDRVITTGENYAYIKIADGCSNCCTFCAIPRIRGIQKSRTIESIVQEAQKLADDGYEEIILTAQDTTRYGQDIYGTPKLVQLLKEIEKIERIKWIRILYSYPETITDELIKTVKQSSKICHYFDIPIQHISDSVLKRMNRKSNGESIRKLIIKLRKEIPDVIIRTTVMVGFPGETQEDFEELYEFLKEAKFDKLGAFMYSKEEGTGAEKMPNQVHSSTKRSRYNKVMKLQQEISRKNLENKIGTIQKVRIDGITKNQKYYIGRTYMDAPEIDGVVYIKNTKQLNLGDWLNCQIIEIKEYDMIGKIN